MRAAGLIEMPPESKVIALPTSPRTSPSGAPGGAYSIVIEPGLVVAAPRDRDEGAHPGRLDLVPADRLEREVREPGEQPLCPLCQDGGGQLVRRCVDELPAAVRPLGHDSGAARRLVRARGAVAADEQPLDAVPFLVVGLPAAGVEGPEDGAVDDRPRLVGRSERQIGIEHPGHRPAAEPDRALDGASCSSSQAVSVDAGRLPDARHRHAVGSELSGRVGERELADAAFDLPVLDQMLEPAAENAVEPRCRAAEPRWIHDRKDEEISLDGLGRRLDCGDLHEPAGHASRIRYYPAKPGSNKGLGVPISNTTQVGLKS